MAMPLFFRAVAEQRHGLLFRQVLQQSQGELLAVVLDSFIARIHAARLQQFSLITAAVFRPGNPAAKNRVAQFFARSQVRHPNVKTIRRQASPASPRRQDPEAIACFDWAVNRLGFEHFRCASSGPNNCLQSLRQPHILGPLLNHNL